LRYADLHPTTDLGAWVATPGYIREQIRALDAEYTTVGKELRVQLEPCLPDKPDRDSVVCLSRMQFAQRVWTPLKDSWDVFVSGHESWYNLMWGAIVDVVDLYRQKLRDIRAKAKQAGFVFQSPEPTQPPESPWASVGKLVKFAVVGGIVIGGIFVLYKVLPRGRERT
jgi:hypothetical protein